MLAAKHNDSAVMTKKSETGLVKLQNFASAVTKTNVHRFKMVTVMAHPLCSSTKLLTMVRIMMAR